MNKEEEAEYIRTEYLADPSRATVDRLAEELQRPGGARSIIAQLSSPSMAIYKKAERRLSKTGEPVIKRSEMITEIGEMFGLQLESLADKQSLSKLYKALKDPDQVRALLTDLEYDASSG